MMYIFYKKENKLNQMATATHACSNKLGALSNNFDSQNDAPFLLKCESIHRKKNFHASRTLEDPSANSATR